MENLILMKDKRFFCNKCKRYFSDVKTYFETHGLDNPPYERISVCPKCNSDDFFSFESHVEKIEIVERLLQVVKCLNLHIDSLENIFGIAIKNCELTDGVEMLIEIICEMFGFLDSSMQNEMFKMTTENDLNRVLKYIKGEG